MRLLPRMETLKAFAKYISLGAMVFAIGLVWNFPYERIRETLTRSLSRSSGYRFDMDRLSPALPIGFKAEGARISGPPVAGKPVDLAFKTLRVSLSPFSILFYPFRKALYVSFAAVQEKNQWKGGFGYGKKESSVNLRTDDFRIDQAFPLSEVDPMLAGSEVKLRAKIEFTTSLSGLTPSLTQGDLTEADGNIKLTATQVSITPPMLKELRFDKIVLDAQLAKGKLDIKSIQLTGPDISGTANGSLRVESYFPRSQLQLDAKVTLSDKAQDLRTLVTTFGSQIGLNMTPQGVVALKVSGPIMPFNRLSVRGY